MLGVVAARQSRVRGSPSTVGCPAVDEVKGGGPSLHSRLCSSVWLTKGDAQAAAPVARGASARLTSTASCGAERRNGVGSRASARSVTWVKISLLRGWTTAGDKASWEQHGQHIGTIAAWWPWSGDVTPTFYKNKVLST
jgi:hypothetical protein